MPRVENHRDRALKLVRDCYQAAVAMQTVDLESINRVRPPELRYGTRAELVREFWNAAGAVATFAVQMQLISPSDAEEILRSYGGGTA
jgi:hypothetical protein